MEEVKNCVYRFLDADGNILYVGSTEQLLSHRLSSHNCGHLCDCCKIEFETDKKIKTETKFCSRICAGKYQKSKNIMSDEMKKKISESLCGERNPFFGKKHSEETRRKMSEAKRRNRYEILVQRP